METKEINENRGNIIKISKKKFIIKFTIMFLIIFLSFIYIVNTYATTEKSPLLVNKFKKAFEKIQEYLILIATPAAGVAICTGLLMRKFKRYNNCICFNNINKINSKFYISCFKVSEKYMFLNYDLR